MSPPRRQVRKTQPKAFTIQPPDICEIVIKVNRQPSAAPARSVPPRHAQRIPYLTNWLILKIGRMIDIAINPTNPPISMIISGSIMLVTALIVAFSSLL